MKWTKKLQRVNLQASFICMILVICSCLSVFFIAYDITYNNVIELLKSRTDAIYNSIDGLLDFSVFEQINNQKDMNTSLYKDYQEKLLEIREVTNVRYLYTAKKNNEGEYVYLIDGLPLNSEDFRNPGEQIESDILDNIDRAYKGNIILPDDIIETSWGKIFLAYYPIHGGENHADEIVGVIGIEMDAEIQYRVYDDLANYIPFILVITCVFAFVIFSWCFKYISNPRRKDLYNSDALTNLKNRASLESDLKNIYTSYSVISIIMVDLDGLKKINDQYGHTHGDEYIVMAGKAISKTFNGKGISYRMGGDEFVIVMESNQREYIEALIQELEQCFQDFSKDFEGVTSLSIGYAIYNSKYDKNIHKTLKRADQIMYQHKKEKKAQRV